MNVLFGHGLFFLILFTVFAGAFTVAQIYEPFKITSSPAYSPDPRPWVQMESPSPILLDDLLFLDSSFIYLPNDFSFGTADLSALLPVSPGLSSYPPSLFVGDPWDEALSVRELFSPPPTTNILDLNFLRRPLSTFGMLENRNLAKNEDHLPQLEVFVHGLPMPVISLPFPLQKPNQFGEWELWGKMEFVFTIFNNSLAGPPVSSKSSGNEIVDELLLRDFFEIAPLLGISDGYYTASVAP